jgi:hypothetical protein
VLVTFFVATAAAQNFDPPGRVGRIRFLEGSVSFQPAGEADWVPAVANRPMTTGDHIWADAGSRAEVQIGSAMIRIGANTGFSFLNLDDHTVQIQLTDGSLSLRVHRIHPNEVIEVDTPNQAFSIARPGLYRVDVNSDGNSSQVTVREGEGTVTGGGQTYSIYSGQSGTFNGTDTLDGQVANIGSNDDFDNWGQSRDRQYDGSRSARYVSPDVVGYEDLDNNGTWRSDPTYGNVWIPASVPNGWAPYREGHWEWISPWGWTWVDDAPWGYAPFHYGRWASIQGSWGWIPGPVAVEPVYAPALVAFIGGAGFGVSLSFGGGGAVGWFPLGPREVYVPSYNVSPAYVNRVNVSNTNVNNTTITNVYNTYNNQTTNRTVNNITYANQTVPGAVTAVPQNTFRSAQPVAKAAIPVTPQQIAKAPVVPRAAVAPTANSVLGSKAAMANKVAKPPAAVVSRPVVAKTTPPPAPVSFAKQQQALAAHPGQPLAAREIQSLRPAKTATASLVKQAPPGKPAQLTPKTASQPAIAKPGQPTPAPATAKANPPAAQPPAARTDRPPTAQQNHPQPSANQPATKPATPPPATAKANPPTAQPPAARAPQPSTQQPHPQPPANQPATANRGQQPENKPANPPPAAAKANPPAAQPPAAHTNQPPAAQQNHPQPETKPAAPPSAAKANPPAPEAKQPPKTEPAHPQEPPKTPAEKQKERKPSEPPPQT